MYLYFPDSPKLPPSLGAKIMKLFIQVAEHSTPMVPLLQLILLQFVPCMPPFIFSMFPNCKEVKSKTNWILGHTRVRELYGSQYGARLYGVHILLAVCRRNLHLVLLQNHSKVCKFKLGKNLNDFLAEVWLDFVII